MNPGWYIGALALVFEACQLRRHWLLQIKHGADAPTHFEAAAARGQLDKPFFGEFQPSGPGTQWAYIGPRAALLLYWPLVAIWHWRRPVCCVVWQLLMAACTMAAVGVLWPDSLPVGLWCVPLAGLILWSSDDTGALGASNPAALLMLALGLTATDPLIAGTWFGAAVAVRVWPIIWLPMLVLRHWGMAPLAQVAGAAIGTGCALTALAWALGFGYDSPAKLWHLFRSLQFGPLQKLVALHRRRPYFLMLAPALMYPTLAWWLGLSALVYAGVFLNIKRWSQEAPVDVAAVWYQDWNGKDLHL